MQGGTKPYSLDSSESPSAIARTSRLILRIKRESTYSWAYLLRRPMHGQPAVVEMYVVVYNDRLVTLNLNQAPREAVYGWTSLPASLAYRP